MDKPTIDTKEIKTARPAAELDTPRGFFPAVTNLAIDATEIGATTAINLGSDVRTELAKGVITIIDSTEALVKSGFALARRLTQRVDGAAAELLGSVEKIVGTSANAARSTAREAAQVAAGALNAAVAPRGN